LQKKKKIVLLSYLIDRIYSIETMKFIFKSLIIIFLIQSGLDVNAQNLYMANLQKSDLVVKGSSTLHDWQMDTEKFDCVVKALNDNNKLIIQKVNFSCNSTSLKSENSMMDKKAWDALKSDDFKTIQFESNEPNEFLLHDKKIQGKIVGELVLSGETRKLILPFNGEMDETGNVKLTGEVSVKMSEFGIKPPTALMGSIKTGDEITIVYDLNFSPTSLISAKGK
jgi:polyisoprenoid-binding protein YceI